MAGLIGLALGAMAWAAGGGADQSLHLACNDFPPHKIEHPGSDGLAGFDVDIIAAALKRFHASAEISYMPWKRALELAERGDYDGLCSCSHTKDREAKLLFSEELGAVSVGLFARSEDALAGVSSVADLKGRKVATVGGYNLEAELITAGAQVGATSSDKSALDMLVGGNVDLLYGYELTTRHFIASDPRSSLIAYKEIRRNPYYFCLSRAMPGADTTMQGFNRSLAEMAKDGSVQRILDRYHVTFR
ncbi:MAG TPA: transporter substrate-binding domain-containing protein [Dongiaceae bacterium]|nr:transporter substrate-binding domain-containing protein [Dongiaceae bacterium]